VCFVFFPDVLAVAACTAARRLVPLMWTLGSLALCTGCVLSMLLTDAYSLHTLFWAPALTWPMVLGFLKLSHRLRLPIELPVESLTKPPPTKQQQHLSTAHASELPLPPPVRYGKPSPPHQRLVG